MPRYIEENEIYKLFNARGVAQFHVGDIDVLPRVEVKEVVHGRWIDAREYCGDYMCSNCDALYGTNKFNYCPNCGAKMNK